VVKESLSNKLCFFGLRGVLVVLFVACASALGMQGCTKEVATTSVAEKAVSACNSTNLGTENCPWMGESQCMFGIFCEAGAGRGRAHLVCEDPGNFKALLHLTAKIKEGAAFGRGL
jgi:hypothetical protein